MRIERLKLQNYRSIERADIEFASGLTIFLGPNGSGKTNTLEAVSLLSVPRSFRGTKDKDLIGWDAKFARVEGQITYPNSPNHDLVVFLQDEKKLQVDGQNQTVSQFLGQFLSILFAPEDVELLTGTPGRRRALLDSHLSALSPIYLQHLISYHRVITRRNRLLSRSHWPEADDLDFWNHQQIEHGVAILEARIGAIEQLNMALPSPLRLKYMSNLMSGDSVSTESFREKQAAILERERQVGHTLLGPQRDDWRLENLEAQMDVGEFGSRGQQRMGVVALKRAQLQVIAAEKEDTGVLLLDDVLSELDAQNQQLLVQSMNEQQTVLTTASLSDVPESMLAEAIIYEFADGGWIEKK